VVFCMLEILAKNALPSRLFPCRMRISRSLLLNVMEVLVEGDVASA
jgi:hypothetical protein